VGASQLAAAPVGIGDLPATYSGLLPCADCVGTRVQVNLLPAHAYVQRLTYMRDGSDQSYYDIGSWSLSEDGRTLTLDGGKVPTRWGVDDTGALRKLDTGAKSVPAAAPSALTRSPVVVPLQPRLRLNGMFRYVAEAPRFRDCRSGLTWPVDAGGDYRALERAYAGQRLSTGAELKASVQGRIEDRPKPDGGGSEPTLVVEAFLLVTPGEVCEDAVVQSGLVNSRWCPVQLGAKPVRASAPSEVWITLDPRAHRFTGSSGCNRINGSFDVQGEALRFGRTASTMKACPEMEIERAFLSALEDTRRYRASGRTLELLGGDGKVLVRLEECNLH
jgi:copper homeostasis protein (lipoprotein)